MLNKIINSKSKTFTAFCFCFLFGIIIASLVNKRIDFVYFYLISFIFISLLIIFRESIRLRYIFVCLMLIVFAIVRYNLAIPPANSDEYIYAHNGEKYTFIGHISKEPDIRSDGVRYIVKGKDLKGSVYVKSRLYPRYKYGDNVRVECDLEKPEPIVEFRYDMYLAKSGVFSMCLNAQIDKVNNEAREGALGYKIDGKKGNFILKGILGVKQAVADRVNMLWHEPYAGFMAGLLYGYRGGLGDLQEDFNRTGLTHIVAISGYNISIIAIVLITLFVHLWIPRKKAFWFVSIGIFLFVVFAGASGSVVRAGIMGFLVLFAGRIGRLNRIGNAMILTAVVMVLHNPYVLVWDSGFQLSFVATIGLIYLSPIIHKWFYKIPEFLGLKESLVSTLAAIILTLPLILYQFGRLSLVAPIVNVLVLWLIPWIMMLGFASVLLSFVFYPLGQILAWITFVGLKYITTIVEWFSSLPFASIDFKTPMFLVLIIYISMIFIFKKWGSSRA